ncbi:MAG: Sir2 family NAD-dependent protein deacetylase, partial [Minicystis sp.]
TQNVDGLHQEAGSQGVIELHGSLAEVGCLSCGALEDRAALQTRLLALNPEWPVIAAEIAPDGDADLPLSAVADFQLAACLACAGPLKPRVVFFGENVPRPVVDRAFAVVDAAEVLLVIGSSLAIFSGYRFLLRAAQRGIPAAMINLGPARGVDLCALHLDGRAGDILPRLAAALRGAPPREA